MYGVATIKIDHDTKGDLLHFTGSRCDLPHHPNHSESASKYVCHTHRFLYHGKETIAQTRKASNTAPQNTSKQPPNPLPTSHQHQHHSTAQHSKTKHTPSKQARQAKPVGHISPKATGPARLSWESRKKQRPNPIHPEGSRKKKEKKKDSQFHASSSKSVALLTDPLACQDSLLSLPSPIHPMRLSKPRLPPPPPPPSRPPSFQVDAMR